MRDRTSSYYMRHMRTALLPIILVCGVRSERKFSDSRGPLSLSGKVVKVQFTKYPGTRILCTFYTH